MKFRLTYEGRLEGNGSPKHKHEIRKVFHPQLQRLWATDPNLIATMTVDKTLPTWKEQKANHLPGWYHLAHKFQRNGYRFVPLATQEALLLAGVDILFLRPDSPGGVIRSGDIDNRLKTLFDALKMPRHAEELSGHSPAPDEDPFFVLLEDDSLLSHVSVETDTLLEPSPSANGQFLVNDARLVITVHLRPGHVKFDNLHFI